MKSNGKIHCYPADNTRWVDLETLFGKSGAYWGCWCTYWLLSNKDFNNKTGSQKRAVLKNLVVENSLSPGLLAYIDNKPVGWCAISPRTKYTRLVKSRVIKPVDDKPVWSVVCFFIHKDYRNRGVATALLQEAVNYARENGAPAIEGYPIYLSSSEEKINTDSAYVGTNSLFEKAGFYKIGNTKAKGAGKPRIIMRNDL